MEAVLNLQRDNDEAVHARTARNVGYKKTKMAPSEDEAWNTPTTQQNKHRQNSDKLYPKVKMSVGEQLLSHLQQSAYELFINSPVAIKKGNTLSPQPC